MQCGIFLKYNLPTENETHETHFSLLFKILIVFGFPFKKGSNQATLEKSIKGKFSVLALFEKARDDSTKTLSMYLHLVDTDLNLPLW